MSARRWFPGMSLPNGTKLVARGKGAGWKARKRCGHVSIVNPAQELGRTGLCGECSNRLKGQQRTKVRKCRSCGTRERKRFRQDMAGGASECMRCARRRTRAAQSPAARENVLKKLRLKRKLARQHEPDGWANAEEG